MRWGLGTRILVLCVFAPLTLFLVTGTWLANQSLKSVQTELESRAALIASQLTLAAELQQGDHGLPRLAAMALTEPAVSSVRILTPEGVEIRLSAEPDGKASAGPVRRRLSNLFSRQFSVNAPLPASQTDGLSDGPQVLQSPASSGRIELQMDSAPLIESRLDTLPPLLAGVTLAWLALVVAGLVTRHSVVGPINQLTDVIRRLGAGDFRARAHLLAADELASLARAVNRTAISMERSQKQLTQQIDKATRDLRETLEAVEIQNAELDIARKRAVSGSRVKSEFLANMSHEIRTPINGILGFADLLARSRLDEDQRDHVRTIRDSANNLLALVNDIIDFSRIEAGKLVIDTVPFDLRDCLEEVLSLMAPAAYGKYLELVNLIYSDVPHKLHGDPVRIRQILTNLIHNAVKFTHKGGVVVRVMRDGDDNRHDVLLRITVTDTGIGLSESDRRKLFKAFSQADTSITRRFGGAGLGLIICRKLIQQMGGSIGLESTPGKGSTFWFTLRCLRQKEPRHTGPPRRDYPLRGRRVLLLDRNRLSRLASRHLLEAWQMDVVEMEAEQPFLEHLRRERWDLALIGLTRAELHSADVESLLSRGSRGKVSLAVLASTVDRNELSRLNRLGADICLPKIPRRRSLYRELCRLTASPQYSTPVSAETATIGIGRGPVSDRFADVRALVVDDNAINRKLVTTLLDRLGVTVDEAADGRQAVDLARRTSYDIIFMDIHMPGMSGEAAARQIRGLRPGHRQCRIVAITANALPGEPARLTGMGMNACLIKPVTEQELTAELRCLQPGRAGRGHDILASGDRQALDRELLMMLVAELGRHRRAVDEAYTARDLQTLRERVHTLHGAASVSGALALKHACRAVEDTLLNEQVHELPAALEQLLENVDQLLTEKHEQSKAD